MESIPTEQCYDRLFAVVEKMDNLKKRKIPMTEVTTEEKKSCEEEIERLCFCTYRSERKAIYLLDTERMKSVLEEAREMRYASEETAEIERLLELDDETMAKMQLKKAIELKDPATCESRDFLRDESIEK